MSERENQNKYNELKKVLEDTIKKILNYETERKLPTEQQEREERINSYKFELVDAYNNLVTHVDTVFSLLNEDTKNRINERLRTFKLRILRALVVLELELELPGGRNIIDINQIKRKGETVNDLDTEIFVSVGSIGSQTPGGSTEQQTTSHVGSDPVNTQNASYLPEIPLNNNQSPEERLNSLINMAPPEQSKADFMRLAGPILNYKYNGDPLKLETFITDVELVEAMAEVEQTELCFKYIKSKLEGRALEAMPENLTTVQQIKDALSRKIKPDSSRVIEGKISALRLIKGNFSTFSKQAEDLAEALRRSLIVEGISKSKAEEMAVNKTIDLCRKTSHTDVVKSVISASSFSSPAEVLAKFITESDIARQEKRERENVKQRKDKYQKPKFDKNKKFDNNKDQKYDKNKKYNKNNHYKNNNNNQSHSNIRVMQGNLQHPPEGGPSTSSAQDFYVLNQ